MDTAVDLVEFLIAAGNLSVASLLVFLVGL